MTVITGKSFNTSWGAMIVLPTPPNGNIVGERIKFHGDLYTVKAIIPPSRPGAKWSLQVEKTQTNTDN